NDSNGIQPGGPGTAVHTPVIDLALGREPGDQPDGGNQDLTVDIGFSASLSLGNLVWGDNNNNGLVDAGEGGVAGAQVELFRSTDTVVNNGDDVKVGATQVTDSSGAYLFSDLGGGRYYVKVTPPVTHTRRSGTSFNTDNGVDNDNNGITQAGAGAPVYSMMVNLSALTEPGNLLAPFGGNADLTIDFGLRPVFLSVGNLVFKDTNGNNVHDAGEGVGGVRVELLNGDGVFLSSTTTSNASSNLGGYQFSNVLPGQYYVRIPASEFGAAKPLQNSLSISPASPVDDGLDDNHANGDSGVDSASPALTGISSPRLTLAEGALPTAATGETGFRAHLDDSADANGNMTVDFGFRAAGPSAEGCYHFAFNDAARDPDGILPAASAWQPAQPYDFQYSAGPAHVDAFDLKFDAAVSRIVLDATFTQLSGRRLDALAMMLSTTGDPANANHAILYLDAHDRAAPKMAVYRYDPALGMQSWQNSANLLVSSGNATGVDVMQNQVTESGGQVRFQFVLDIGRVNNAANWAVLGVSALTWEGILMGGNAGLGLWTLDLDGAPAFNAGGALTAFPHTSSAATEGGFAPSAGLDIITQPCPSSPWVSIGNLIFSDTNFDGVKQSNESGITGATVQLFSPGADGAIGGEGVNADTQVGQAIVTTSNGAYNFTNLIPGKYYVRVMPPAGFPLTGGGPVPLDNGVNNDNNGHQPGGPGTFAYSPVIDLQPGQEPAVAVDGDGTNGDATIDFGFWSGFSVGDLVWHDINNNGQRDTGEPGVAGIFVELMDPGADGLMGGAGANADTVVATTTTNSSGAYAFRVYQGGKRYARITPTAALSLASDAAVQLDNGVNNDSNGVQTGLAGSPIVSMVFELMPRREPGTSGSTNNELTIDFGILGCPVINISPTALPLVTHQTSYSQTLNAEGGKAPYTWSVVAGTLPQGLTLTSGGLLGGVTTALPGNYSFTIRARDLSGCESTRSYTLTVVCPTLAITPSALPDGTQGAAFSQTLTATGGTGPYSWAQTSGTLPAGVTLSGAGVLSGTPQAPGVYNFTVRATDSLTCQVSRAYAWTVQCPPLSISPATLPAATLDAAYTAQTLTASGGTAPYAWTVSAGALPQGMGLAANGTLTGTPSGAPGAYNFTARATDSHGCAVTRAYVLTVNCGVISIAPASLPEAVQSAVYAAQTFTAAGGTGPYTWSISAGSLPAGITLNADGLLSGTPTAAPGAYSFTLRVADAYNCQATRAYALQVLCPVISITPASLASAVQFDAYHLPLSASGGQGAYAWTVSAGALPNGVTLSSAGLLYGTPQETGVFSFTARATDGQDCSATRAYSLTVLCPMITITPATLEDAPAHVAYSRTFTASGGLAPYTWDIASGALPQGMTLSAGGVLGGAPSSAPGVYEFTVRAKDAAEACSATRVVSLTVSCSVVQISPASLANATVGASYSVNLSSTLGSAPFSYSVVSGSLPPGLTLSSTGLLSGTPTQAGTVSFTIESRNTFDCSGTRAYTLTSVCPVISITPSTPPPAYHSHAYTQSLTAAGGTGPYTWALVSGSLPAGLSFSAAGVISGTPTAFGTSIFNVRATDAYNCQSTQVITLLVKGLAIGDTVYDDANFNGQRDTGESGVPGVTVQLWDPGADNAIGGTGANSDSHISSTVTDAQGRYTFTNLLPGRYYARVLPPAHLPMRGGNPVSL
ncbi:MAG TPA: hypothetical protein DIT64_13575, partial [Verrucomicrobiales bacterium]|nr:hypothetical protein [Verrucomicrobiales bacterium]